jgi:hypothetical protein
MALSDRDGETGFAGVLAATPSSLRRLPSGTTASKLGGACGVRTGEPMGEAIAIPIRVGAGNELRGLETGVVEPMTQIVTYHNQPPGTHNAARNATVTTSAEATESGDDESVVAVVSPVASVGIGRCPICQKEPRTIYA